MASAPSAVSTPTTSTSTDRRQWRSLEATIPSPDSTPDLEATIAAQAAVIAELRVTIAEQARVIDTLTARVAVLERQLGRHSRNSSKPPSSDGLAKPPAAWRERRGGRRAGKQPNAPGTHLAQVRCPDEVVMHRPDRCRGCGRDLTLAVVAGVQARQVFDLPPVRLHVVEHRVERRRCACGQVTAADFPAQARAPACYGPGVRALGVYLGAWQHLPVARGAELLGHLLGAQVSSGWLSGLQAEAAVALTGFAARARTVLADAEVVHVDETGARVAGRLHWVHSTSTPRWSWYRVDAKRGKQAMDAAGVLPAFAGVAVHDFWSPYWRYPNAVHAVCAAHLLRELEEAATEPGQGWAGALAEWLTVAIGTAAQARAGGAERLDAAIVANLLGRYDQVIATGHAANPHPPPTPGPPPAQTTGGSVPAGAAGHPPHRGLPVPGRPARPTTNNQAERDLRMVKLQQKISGCWRTLTGAQAFLTVRSYLVTARKHGVNPVEVLRQLFDGNPWMPAPGST